MRKSVGVVRKKVGAHGVFGFDIKGKDGEEGSGHNTLSFLIFVDNVFYAVD